ncbi:MAG: hypothetical protein R6V41_04905 [Desulfobacteraceae bacterium]
MKDEIERIQKRITELEDLMEETRRRLPAHSVKPQVMKELFEYEDEYDELVEKLNKIRSGEG